MQGNKVSEQTCTRKSEKEEQSRNKNKRDKAMSRARPTQQELVGDNLKRYPQPPILSHKTTPSRTLPSI